MSQGLSSRSLKAKGRVSVRGLSNWGSEQNVALKWVIVSVLWFYHVSIIQHRLYTHLHLLSPVTEEQTFNV